MSLDKMTPGQSARTANVIKWVKVKGWKGP